MKNPGVAPKSKISKPEAEDLAIAALVHLSGEPERMARFLALSGLSVTNLRAAAADPGFLAAVLDYLLSDERLLVAFAADHNLAPERIGAARRALGDPSPEEP